MRLMSYIILLAILSISAVGQFTKFAHTNYENVKDLAAVKKEWNEIGKLFKDFVNKGIKMLTPLIIENMEGLNISSSCTRDSLQIINGIRRQEPWAMRFLDSSSKGIDGAMSGTILSYGAYDECIDTVARNKHSGKHNDEVLFSGKYCLWEIKPPLPPKKSSLMQYSLAEELKQVLEKGTVISELAESALFYNDFSFRLGLCVPSGCNVDDINQLLAKGRCVYSFTGLMMLLATLTDVYYYYSSRSKHTGTLARVLFAFSFLSNFRRFVDVSAPHENLRCLNGIRFITMSWVILGHSYLMVVYQIVAGMNYMRDKTQEFATQVLVNAALCVETFFFLGGFLVCYHSTKHVKTANRKFNVKLHFLSRLWRILPVYTYVVLFTFLLPTTSSGPLAYYVFKIFTETCKETWWTKLLFINNFYYEHDKCIHQGWYLAVDMQLYIGALIIILPLFRWPKVGAAIAVICATAFMTATAGISYVNGYGPTALTSTFAQNKMDSYFVNLYHMPYPHASSYIIGIMAGYLVAMYPKLEIPKVMQIFGWPIAILLAMSALYGTYEWNRGREPTVLETIFYSSCSRTAWALSVAWMVICCTTDHGGVVNCILSWKMWIPLSRLTFIAYLVHPLVQLTFVAHLRSPIDPKHAIMVWLYFGHLMVTYGIAFVGYMLIESPFFSLGKLIFSQDTDRYHKNKDGKATNQTADNVEV